MTTSYTLDTVYGLTGDDIEALKAAAEKAKAQGWRVRTNRHTATNGDEWGWLSDSDDRSNYMGGLKVTWEGKEAQATARFVVSSPSAILELIAQRAALVEAVRDLARCLLPVHMSLMEREMVGDPVQPAAVVLSFMGSGASDSVTAREITDALDAASAALSATTTEA